MECFEANRAFGALRRDIFEYNNHSMGGVLRYSLAPIDGFGWRWWYRGRSRERRLVSSRALVRSLVIYHKRKNLKKLLRN